MEHDFGANIVVLTDEDNVDHEFEHLDTIELNSKLYLAFVEAGLPEDSEEAMEVVILRLDTDENGEEILSSVDDEAELEAAYNTFMDEAFDEEE